MTKFANTFKNMHFCVKQYIGFQKQSVEGALKAFAKYLKIIFDEVHFIVNLKIPNSIKNLSKFNQK